MTNTATTNTAAANFAVESIAPSPRREAVIIAALSLAAMIVSMMQTLPVPILGRIQSDLGVSTAGVSWVTTATLLSAAVFTPLLGRYGDQHGKKRTLVGVLVVMVIGSIVAALAHNLPLLILGRVLQGTATAIFPLALSVLREELRPHRLPGAMALVSGTLAFGSGLALVATGLLTSGPDADYRNAFWMATGFAVLALIAAPIGGRLIRLRGPRFVLGLTAVLGALPFAWLAFDHTHTASVIGAGMVIGAALSLGYAAMPAIIMSNVPHHQSGIANGINSISRSTGSAIGSAVVTTILASMTIANLPEGVPAMPSESAFTVTFSTAAVAFVLVGLVGWLGLRPPRSLAASEQRATPEQPPAR